MKSTIAILFSLLFFNNAWSQSCNGNCIDGEGTYTYATGAVYVGFWKDGKRHGQGITTSSNGEEYIGEYQNGLRSGYGVYSFPSGENTQEIGTRA